jgi:VanZ family protein
MQQAHRKWLWWVAVGLWIGVIFGLSSDPFSKQATSPFFEQLLLWIFPAISEELQEALQFAVRKCAHATEYGVLAALVYQALRSSPSPWRGAGLALALVAAVAIADETRQALSAVRSSSARDVGIDVAGGAVALLLLAGARRWMQTRRVEREEAG